MADPRPSYWAVVPSVVRYDEELAPNAKLLYAEISALTDERGYCYAQNSYFCRVYGWSQKTVSRLLIALKEKGFIRVDVIRNKRTHGVEERRIYAGINPALNLPPKIVGKSPPELSGRVPDKNEIANKEEQNSIINPPIPPTGGRCASLPKWDPEGFEKFWDYYRTHARGENRSGAVKAWDKLRPDKELIQTMGKALMVQIQSEEWRRGVGIPHMATWLNNRRWEDVTEATAPAAPVDERRLPVWN